MEVSSRVRWSQSRLSAAQAFLSSFESSRSRRMSLLWRASLRVSTRSSVEAVIHLCLGRLWTMGKVAAEALGKASLRMGPKSKWELTPGAAPMASSTAALKAASCSKVALVRSSLGGGGALCGRARRILNENRTRKWLELKVAPRSAETSVMELRHRCLTMTKSSCL